MLLDIVRQTIENHHMLERGLRVLVAVSGGPDSVALLDALVELRDEYGVELHVAHLDHKLRRESADEAAFVRELVTGLNLAVVVESADVRGLAQREKLSLEHAARNARREFLVRTANAVKADRIALGHHADDRVETVLMRILRGTGLDGLAGMRPVALPFIRPLFDVMRAQIEEYVAARGLTYREDASNRDQVFMRNRIRWELVPPLEAVQPGFKRSILRLSELAAQETRWLRTQARMLLGRALVEQTPDSVTLRLASLSSAFPPMPGRAVREAVRLLLGETMDIEQGHIEAVLRLAERRRTGARLHLPRGLVAERGYGTLIIRVGEAEIAEPVGEFALDVPGETEVSPLGVTVVAEVLAPDRVLPPIEEPPNAAQFDHAMIRCPLTLRTRRRGDRFRPLGMDGSMKLHDFFVNRKVPRRERGRVPIITAGGEIAWVVGWRIDDRFKVTEATEAVLRLEVRPSHAGE